MRKEIISILMTLLNCPRKLSILKNVKKQILNVGSGSGIKISVLLDKMKNLYGIKKKIFFSKKYNKSEHQNYISSNLKVEKFLNWKPKKNLSKELNNYIRWFKKL